MANSHYPPLPQHASPSVALGKERHLCRRLPRHETGVGPRGLVKGEAADGRLHTRKAHTRQDCSHMQLTHAVPTAANRFPMCVVSRDVTDALAHLCLLFDLQLLLIAAGPTATRPLPCAHQEDKHAHTHVSPLCCQLTTFSRPLCANSLKVQAPVTAGPHNSHSKKQGFSPVPEPHLLQLLPSVPYSLTHPRCSHP